MANLPALGNPKMHPDIIAYLGPSLQDDRAVAFMRHIHINHEEFSEYHRKTITGCYKNPDDDDFDVTTDSEAESPKKTDLVESSGYCYAELMLRFDNIQSGGNPLGFTAGRGSSKFNDGTRGVDLCLSNKGQNNQKISPVHAMFFFHPRSGVLCVKGSHVILYLANRFRFGNLELILRVPKHSDESYQQFLEARDNAFSTAGWALPNSYLSSLPGKEPFPRIGSALVHTDIAGGGFGWVKAGVQLHTGDPLAIKEIHVGGENSLADLKLEIEASLTFPGVHGLLQASEIRCGSGCYVDAAKLERQGKFALSFCRHAKATVNFVYPLAVMDLAHYEWGNATLQFILAITRDLLEGIRAMHRAGWMHRDITMRNILIMSENPPKAAVTDFGKAVHAQTAKDTYLCPERFQAPEVNGKEYTKKIDCWNAGLVLCAMLIPKDFNEYLDRESKQNDEFLEEIKLCLKRLGNQGRIEKSLARVATSFIAKVPDNRMSMSQALCELPEWDSEKDRYVFRYGHVAGPTSKVGKTTVAKTTTRPDAQEEDTAASSVNANGKRTRPEATIQAPVDHDDDDEDAEDEDAEEEDAEEEDAEEAELVKALKEEMEKPEESSESEEE